LHLDLIFFLNYGTEIFFLELLFEEVDSENTER
jgi:hypothetical protein